MQKERSSRQNVKFQQVRSVRARGEIPFNIITPITKQAANAFLIRTRQLSRRNKLGINVIDTIRLRQNIEEGLTGELCG